VYIFSYMHVKFFNHEWTLIDTNFERKTSTRLRSLRRAGAAKRLQRRTAKSHRYLIGAGLGTGFTHFIGVTRVATTYTDEVRIGPVVGHRSNYYSVTVDVDVGRGRPAPSEIHCVPALHPAP
jgi:hypothetical protein